MKFHKTMSSRQEKSQSRLIVAKGKDFEQSLFGVLNCPTCHEYMEPPITLCETGHNICNKCKPRLKLCPSCRSQLLETRNVSLEAIARELSYPCRYQDYGCQEKHSLDTIASHHYSCFYRVYNCPLKTYEKCSWHGSKSEIDSHLKTAHPANNIELRSLKSSSVSWEVSNAECYHDTCNACFFFDEIFMYHKQFDIAQKKLCIAVKYMGPRENVRKFRYQFRMWKNGGAQEVRLSCITHHHSDDLSIIFQTGECVRVDFDMLMSYVKGTRTMHIIKSHSY